MKRHSVINSLVTLVLLSLLACEKQFPTTDTIVTGKVTDENNIPVDSVMIGFSGVDVKGILKQEVIFDITEVTNKEGVYRFSILMPNGTDFATIVPIGNRKLILDRDYDIYLIKDGISRKTGPIEMRRKDYGKINTLDFQIFKK